MTGATPATQQQGATREQVQTTPASARLGSRVMDGAVWMSMNVPLASTAVALILCVSTWWEATGVNAAAAMNLQMISTLVS